MNRDEIVFTSFYTPDYQVHARQLLGSLKRHKLRRYVKRVGTQGSWILNVRWKPTFIQRVMRMHKDATAIVWLDADARVNEYPDLFFHIKTDLACRFLYWPRVHKVKIHLGTFFIRNNRVGRGIVDRWVERMKHAPMNLRCPEQEVLYDLLLAERPRTLALPERYCHVMRHTDKRAVIAQWQQSREEREPEKLKRLMDQEDQPCIHDWKADIAFMREKQP